MIWKSIWELCKVILCFWLLLRSFIKITKPSWTQFWAGSSRWPSLNQRHWTGQCQEVFQRILSFGALIFVCSTVISSAVECDNNKSSWSCFCEVSAVTHFQTIISFSHAQLLGTSSCRTEAELMSKSKYLLNFETIRLMKLEFLWCAATFCSVCAPPKAHLVKDTLLNSSIKSHKIRTYIGVGTEPLLFASEVHPSIILLWIHPQTLVVHQLSFKVRRPKKTSYKVKID